MTQVFHPSMNTFARVTIFGAAFFALGLLGVAYAVYRSPYVTGLGVPSDLPGLVCHEHHVNALGIDCRYCHTSVE
ncbi:MAG: cytochrome C, partial [Isosphaeraceae bacterium]